MTTNPEVAAFFAKAQTYLRSARVLVELPDPDSAVSRGYYAMFYAAEAALLSRNLTAHSHRGVIGLFGEVFVQSGIVPRACGRQLAVAYDKRQTSDYDAATKISQDAARRFVDEASAFVAAVEDVINSR